MKKSTIDRMVESYAKKKAVRKNIVTAPSIDELKGNCFNRVFLRDVTVRTGLLPICICGREMEKIL